jgi:hypothetical protein
MIDSSRGGGWAANDGGLAESIHLPEEMKNGVLVKSLSRKAGE